MANTSIEVIIVGKDELSPVLDTISAKFNSFSNSANKAKESLSEVEGFCSSLRKKLGEKFESNFIDDLASLPKTLIESNSVATTTIKTFKGFELTTKDLKEVDTNVKNVTHKFKEMGEVGGSLSITNSNVNSLMTSIEGLDSAGSGLGKIGVDLKEVESQFNKVAVAGTGISSINREIKDTTKNVKTVESASKGLKVVGGELKEVTKNALKSADLWALGLEAAITGINALFDHLNKKSEERMQQIEQHANNEAKQLKVIQQIQNGMSKEEWQKVREGADLGNKNLTTESFGAIQTWAAANKDTNAEAAKVWELMTAAIDKNKKKIEESTDAYKEQKKRVEELKKASEDLLNSQKEEVASLKLSQLQDVVGNEDLSIGERETAAQNLNQAKQNKLTEEKEKEIKSAKDAKLYTEELGNTIEIKYKLKTEELVKENQANIEAIQKTQDQAAKEYQDAREALNKQLIDSDMQAAQEILNNEKEFYDKRIEAAKTLYEIKKNAIKEQLEIEKAAMIQKANETGKSEEDTGKTDQEIEKINEDYKKLYESRLGEIDKEYQNTIAGLNTATKSFDEQLNELVGSLSKGAGNITSALSGLDKIFGTNTADIQQAISSGMSAISSGAQAFTSFMKGDIVGAISSAISAVGSIFDVFDSLFESTEEGLVKMLGKQGFDDTYSEELIEKIADVSDRMGDSSYGFAQYLEEFFAETDISNEEEFSRMSDMLNEQIGEYVKQGHTTEEAFEKYGDELEQLTDAQEKYGFESTESLKTMIAIQKQQTSAGRVSGITDAINGVQTMIDAMSEYGYSAESFTAVFGLVQNLFDKLRAEGLSTQEIFEKISPVVESAKKAAEAAGVSTGPIDDLMKFYDMMEASAPLFDVISGIGTVLEGLTSTGTLTQDNLNSLSQTTLETYSNMRAEGFTAEQIAAAMGPEILEIAESAEKYGYTLSADMQALVDQMKAAGVETEKTDVEVLQEWGDEYLVQSKAWGDSMIETIKSFSEYQEGGTVSGNPQEAHLAWVHGGETIIPMGSTLLTSSLSQPCSNVTIKIMEGSDGTSYLKNLIKVTVEEESKHGNIKIPESAVISG